MTDKHKFQFLFGEYGELNFAAQLGPKVFTCSLTFSLALTFFSFSKKLNLETIGDAKM